MKFPFFSILFLSACTISSGQTSSGVDTLYANEHKIVSMFFPKSIRQGITGSTNYAFTYNREKEQYFGLLQATPGEDSNLLVITIDGEVYSYILRYSKKIDSLSYFVSQDRSIGNENYANRKRSLTKMPLHDSISPPFPSTHPSYSDLCTQLLRNPRPFNQVRYKDGVSLKVTKSIYYSNEVYFVFEITNVTEIDYEINTLDLFKVNGNKKRKSSYQELHLSPVYTHQMPKIVPKGQTYSFIYVYPKFTLSKRERLILKLDELNGGRDLVFRIK